MVCSASCLRYSASSSSCPLLSEYGGLKGVCCSGLELELSTRKHTHTHQRSRGLDFSFDRPNVNGQRINTRAVLPALLRVELSPYWLRTVEVGFWQFHRDGVDVWVLLGDFQLCRQKSRPRYVRTNTTFITNTPQDILTLHRPHEATSVYAALSNSPYLNDRVTFLNNTHMQVNEHVGKVTGCLLLKGQYTQNE